MDFPHRPLPIGSFPGILHLHCDVETLVNIRNQTAMRTARRTCALVIDIVEMPVEN